MLKITLTLRAGLNGERVRVLLDQVKAIPEVNVADYTACDHTLSVQLEPVCDAVVEVQHLAAKYNYPAAFRRSVFVEHISLAGFRPVP